MKQSKLNKNGIPKDNVPHELRKAGIKGGVHRRKGEWELAAENHISGKDKERKKGSGRKKKFSDATMMAAAKDKACGMTSSEIAAKYGMSMKYLNDAVQSIYVNAKPGKEILKGVLLDNAIATGMRVRATIDDLTPMQSVVASGIMTQRFIELDKHSQQSPADLDFTELAQLGQVLQSIDRKVALLPDSSNDAVIDIQAESNLQ